VNYTITSCPDQISWLQDPANQERFSKNDFILLR